MANRVHLSAEVVESCYRVLLGREPENADVVAEKTGYPTYDALISAMLTSEEYARRFPSHYDRYYYGPKPEVECEVDPSQLAAMFERIRQEWGALGELEPYWSVSTGEEYKTAVIDDGAVAGLYDSGAATARLVDIFAGRCGVEVGADGVCLEFGCGVGRVTTHLARRFRQVIAVDISAGNLALCDAWLKRQNIENVQTLLISSPAEISALPNYDFLLSTIVFQHNPPPVQHHLLDVLLSKISGDGAFLFQAPTHTPGYSFNAAEYMASPPGGMEMHSLPMAEIFRLISKNGSMALEVLMDGWTGLYGSHTFFGIRNSVLP